MLGLGRRRRETGGEIRAVPQIDANLAGAVISGQVAIRIELVHYETKLTSTVVDGDVLSNFPVWIFEVEDRDASRPTFGFKLVGGRTAGSSFAGITHALGWPVEMRADIYHTTCEASDRFWVSHATFVRTCAISASGIATTDFNLAPPSRPGCSTRARRLGPPS